MYAAYCERGGRPMIGVFGTLQEAEAQTCDRQRIASVNAAEHARSLPAYFSERDVSYPKLRAAIESQHPL